MGKNTMGSFVTLSLQSLKSLMEACHNCATGNPAQVSIGDTLSVRLGSEVVPPYTFLCCGTIIRTDGAIFWHSEEITPDAIACSNQASLNSLEVKQSNIEEGKELDGFENIIVKCEEDNGKKFESEEYFNGIVIEEDPLLVDDTSLAKAKIATCYTVAENSMDQEEEITSDPVNRILRKNLVGILSQQDSLGPIERSCKDEVGGPPKRTKYPESFTCEFCGKVFKGKERAYQFYYHRNREHTHEMIYKCDICSKEFWGDRELLAHMAGHRDQGHICHICGQKFNAKKNLKAHLPIHISIREHVCRYCDKRFRRKDHLTVHERVHTGIRPYQCAWCESSYPQKHQLKLHIQRCPVMKRHDSKLHASF